MSEWQPIDTAPKDGTEVSLTYFDDEGQGEARAGYWNQEREMWETATMLFSRSWFTHWMPLPPPPATKSQPE